MRAICEHETSRPWQASRLFSGPTTAGEPASASVAPSCASRGSALLLRGRRRGDAASAPVPLAHLARGKRKKATRKPQAAKKAAVLDKTFKCLFCMHPGTIVVRMSTKERVGRLDCSNCGQHFESNITHLSREIDVYTDWLDAAEEVDKREEAPPLPKRRRADADDDEDAFGDRRPAASRAALDDDDDDLPDAVGAY